MKELPKIINDRLSRNSSNAEIFNSSKEEYKTALKNSGYKNIDFKYIAENKMIIGEIGKETSYGLTRHLANQFQPMLENDF